MSKYSLDTIVARAKRKWFVYPNSEIYWWLANAWDYGPYGALLKKNISDLWIHYFVTMRDDMVLMDTAIIANPQTWVASGHAGAFGDALIDDKNSKQRFRADKLIEEWIEKYIIDDLAIDNEYYRIFPIRFDVPQRFGEIKKIKGYKVNGDINNLKLHTINYDLKYNKNPDIQISNLVPESRGNEMMTKFINTFIPNNPDTKKPADWTDARQFSMMLQTSLWVIEDDSSKAYLRPETCQSLFTNFKNLVDTTRVRLPLGMAQVGKAFRNEITPGQFLYRTREFEQMEIEYFVPNDLQESQRYFEMWKELSMRFWQEEIAIKPENLRFREHEKDELSFYSAGTFDVEYNYPRWWGELQGIANRTDYDLKQHQQTSGKDMQYTDPKSWARYIPYVIEPSFGLSRTVMAVMMDCYDEEEIKEWETRIVARFPYQLAPIKYAVLPLIEKNEDMVKLGRDIAKKLKISWISTEFDIWGNIGKRYRRQDEIGTPYCICVDHQSLEDGTVTIRDRDTMEQTRVHWEEIGVE